MTSTRRPAARGWLTEADCRIEDFRAVVEQATDLDDYPYADEHYAQLPLGKGDAAFFNPAVFHGAGTNRSADVRRIANLLQVSSAFGRAMESVDRTAMCEGLFPVLAGLRASGHPERGLRNVVACSADGYAFPTNVDRDQPIGGLAPQTQAELMWRALQENWDADAFRAELHAHARRRGTDPA